MKDLNLDKKIQSIEDGLIVGLGYGSTIYCTIKRTGELVSETLQVSCIPTSLKTEKLPK